MISEHPGAIALVDGDTLTPDSAEVARVWITNGAESSVWINPHLLEEPKVMGYLLADTLRHAARAYAQRDGTDEGDMAARIYAGLLEELQNQYNEITTIKPSRSLN
jgi:hypothetical protein